MYFNMVRTDLLEMDPIAPFYPLQLSCLPIQFIILTSSYRKFVKPSDEFDLLI